MKPLLSILFAALLFAGCAKKGEDPSVIKRALAEKVDKFVEAFNKQDIDGLTADHWKSPDLVVYYPDGNYVGHDALKQSWQNFFSTFSVKRFAVTEIHAEVSGMVAYQWGLYDLAMQAKNGGPEISSPGRFSQVWKNMNGTWVIVVDHASVPLPPPPPPQSASDKKDVKKK